MSIMISIDADRINSLDLSPVQTVIDKWVSEGAIAKYEQQIQFEIEYPREELDPREISEIPEVRLWFIRLDSYYPWLPFLLDWKAGELARYAAMLVPHQFHRSEGIQYNPEALEMFLMSKIFVLTDWLNQQEIPSKSKLMAMSQMFGYDLEEDFFDVIVPLK
ncbi:MAG: CRR6 family NdhI maturation factor [Microcoleus sp. CSU_2_2]|nr:CRR6 family NdhI maturation factor [Microcoleus sp. SU_5_3]NJS10140.1 CRR6 family NdhI maturation factor [Microcoleus sp. CSU_2_2]